MGVVVPLIDPENYKQVRQRILKLYHDDLVRITDSHAWPRMLERDIDITDVNEILRNGRIINHSKPGNCWRYVLEGYSLGHPRRPLRCVVEINGLLIVVTIMLRGKGGKWQ